MKENLIAISGFWIKRLIDFLSSLFSGFFPHYFQCETDVKMKLLLCIGLQISAFEICCQIEIKILNLFLGKLGIKIVSNLTWKLTWLVIQLFLSVNILFR